MTSPSPSSYGYAAAAFATTPLFEARTFPKTRNAHEPLRQQSSLRKCLFVGWVFDHPRSLLMSKWGVSIFLDGVGTSKIPPDKLNTVQCTLV